MMSSFQMSEVPSFCRSRDHHCGSSSLFTYTYPRRTAAYAQKRFGTYASSRQHQIHQGRKELPKKKRSSASKPKIHRDTAEHVRHRDSRSSHNMYPTSDHRSNDATRQAFGLDVIQKGSGYIPTSPSICVTTTPAYPASWNRQPEDSHSATRSSKILQLQKWNYGYFIVSKTDFTYDTSSSRFSSVVVPNGPQSWSSHSKAARRSILIQSFRQQLRLALQRQAEKKLQLRADLQRTLETSRRSYDPDWPHFPDVLHT